MLYAADKGAHVYIYIHTVHNYIHTAQYIYCAIYNVLTVLHLSLFSRLRHIILIPLMRAKNLGNITTDCVLHRQYILYSSYLQVTYSEI